MKTKYFLTLIAIGLFTGCKKAAVNQMNSDTAIPKVTAAITQNTIKSFVFNDFSPAVKAAIADSNITFNLRPGTDPTYLKPTITLSLAGSVNPASLAFEDFSTKVKYQVKNPSGRITATYYAQENRPKATAKDKPVAPLKLCIYYGYPSLVKLNNGSTGTINDAVNAFANFDIIIFGDGIDSALHSDHAKTDSIISGLKSAKPSIKIYGYIDLGVKKPAHNLTAAKYKQHVDQWKAMGVTGVFADDFGADFGVSRTRQNNFITYAHNANLSVFANSNYIGEALDHSSLLSNKDYYLMEPLLVGVGKYYSLDDFKKKADSAYYYMKTIGIGIAAVATIPGSRLSAASNTTDKFTLGWFAASLYDFDAFQFTDTYYSSLNNVLYRFSGPAINYGTSLWTEYDWVKTVSNQEYTRSFGNSTLHITGNGSTRGRGFITR